MIPGLPTDDQTHLLRSYQDLLFEWNSKVNLVSRKLSHEDLWHHITHCLALTHHTFPDGARVVDWGAGGGLPTIPLAIMNPKIHVTAIDATRKKIDAVVDMVERLGLKNITAVHTRADEWKGAAGFSVSRATAPLSVLWTWHRAVARRQSRKGKRSATHAQESVPLEHPDPHHWRSGLIALKGGDLTAELVELSKVAPDVRAEITDLEPILGAAFSGKVIVAVSAQRST